jgi:hypothetical protein
VEPESLSRSGKRSEVAQVKKFLRKNKIKEAKVTKPEVEQA